MEAAMAEHQIALPRWTKSDHAARFFRKAWPFLRRVAIFALRGIAYASLYIAAMFVSVILLIWTILLLVDMFLIAMATYLAVHFVLRLAGRNGIWDSRLGYPIFDKRTFQKKSARRSNL